MRYKLLILVALLFFSFSTETLAELTRAKRISGGIAALGGRYKTHGTMTFAARGGAGIIPSFAAQESIPIWIDDDKAPGWLFHLGYHINEMVSWSVVMLGTNSDGKVAFTTVGNGTSHSGTVDITSVFISPLLFTFYPLPFVYVGIAPGVGAEKHRLKTTVPYLQDVKTGIAGPGLFFTAGLEFMLTNLLALNAGVLAYGVSTGEKEKTFNPLEFNSYSAIHGHRTIRYRAVRAGATFYF